MTLTIDVIFENGVFRPLTPPALPEGKRLRIRMEPATSATPEEILKLAASVFDGLSDEEVDEVERIATNRKAFFKDRPI